MQRTLRPSHRQPAIPQQLAICVQPSTELEGGVCLQGCLRWCLGASWGGLLHMPVVHQRTRQKKCSHLPASMCGCSCTCSFPEIPKPKGIPQNGKLEIICRRASSKMRAH